MSFTVLRALRTATRHFLAGDRITADDLAGSAPVQHWLDTGFIAALGDVSADEPQDSPIILEPPANRYPTTSTSDPVSGPGPGVNHD